MNLTLNSVSLSGIGDAVSVQESILSPENIFDHLLHGALVKVLLCCLRSTNLIQAEINETKHMFFTVLAFDLISCVTIACPYD